MRVVVGDDAGRGGGLWQELLLHGEDACHEKQLSARGHRCCVRQTIPLVHTSTSPRGVRAESNALLVVAAEGLAVDEGERGDDEDDAGRCRSDARGQPSTAFSAAERVGGTVARAGVDIAREREKKFRECPAFVTALNGSRHRGPRTPPLFRFRP